MGDVYTSITIKRGEIKHKHESRVVVTDFRSVDRSGGVWWRGRVGERERGRGEHE